MSNKWLLGPQTVVRPILINRQVSDNGEAKLPAWIIKVSSTPYNLKASRINEWIILKWKENMGLECGEQPQGYYLIFDKIWFNGPMNISFPLDRFTSYMKFIPFNDKNLVKSKIMQSDDWFYENVLKIRLETFFDGNEVCYFNGRLRFQLNLVGHSENKNNEQAEIILNLAEEGGIRDRLLLRKIIPLSKQKHESQKARVLITWIPKSLNQISSLHYTNTFTLQWIRLDPISHENASLPSTRLISWPQANNPIMMNDAFITPKTATATTTIETTAAIRQQYSEYLIAIDELLMDATYLFQLIETDPNQTINVSAYSSEGCLKKTELLVYITAVGNSRTAPKLPPDPPKVRLLDSPSINRQKHNTVCPSTSVHLAWPNYLRHLQTNQTSEYDSAFIYTSPVTNYTLQYAEITEDNFYDDVSYHRSSINYDSVMWERYQPSPQIGDENDFVVNGLRPHKMYIFRLAAQTDAGQSPFSLPTDVVITEAQRPCSTLLHLKVDLKSADVSKTIQHSSNAQLGENEFLGKNYCEFVVVKWKVLDHNAWNSQTGWYHISYRLWSSNHNDGNSQSFNLFIKHDENKVENSSYLQVELQDFITK
ncbi:unnamed protein product [Heterobilharzia americana]|nr:unnamed protein product [Heterobilharzia americana]